MFWRRRSSICFPVSFQPPTAGRFGGSARPWALFLKILACQPGGLAARFADRFSYSTTGLLLVSDAEIPAGQRISSPNKMANSRVRSCPPPDAVTDSAPSQSSNFVSDLIMPFFWLTEVAIPMAGRKYKQPVPYHGSLI